MATTVNSVPIAAAGHNRSPFELSSEEIDALFTEATHWCDGSGVNTAAEEANVDELLGMLRDAKKSADTRRAAEKKPHDDAARAVQAQWLPIINKADLAADACKRALQPYRQRIAAEKEEAAAAARAEADAKRKTAEDALRASQVDDLTGRAAAEALVTEAKRADKAANRADKAATTGLGLRTVYTAEIADRNVFAKHVWTNHPDDMNRFLADLASDLVKRGLRTIPGVNVHENKVAI